MVDFLVIGPFNSLMYANVFPLIKDHKMKLGYGSVKEFSDGTKFGNTIWSTSFDVKERGYLKLKEYKEGDYKKFDNYNAINIDRTEDIPDYDDVMGVPVTFLEKWNPGQFDIVGLLTDNPGDNFYFFNGERTYTDPRHHKSKCGVMDGHRCFSRILIKKK